ncbi:YdbL family protein [Sphingorhabdus arenilitoris]|uniref:YdbL family protein n=1 Tax=Sphingorhabdus arenilitoris TaxID=1490041 RepID=A0ABV8RG41_9SPHN
MSKNWIEVTAAAALLAVSVVPGVSVAQTLVDQYKGAKSSGLVGEKMDGYIGAVSTPSASIEALISAINIKRKDVYFKVAETTRARPDEAAFTGGCTNIKNTKPGEYYQAPNGSWVQRTDGPPQLDSKCPQ